MSAKTQHRLFHRFLRTEASGGIVLMGAAALAMIAANSPLRGAYEAWLALPYLTHFINDGLMALFFLLIGLEIKRELTEGELSTWRKAALPLGGALGGVITPALIYAWFNAGTPLMRGWAVPTATDIAFSLGVLMLLGKRVPAPLKIFLMAVAVIDDLIAVLVIAFFYTDRLDVSMLLCALAVAAVLFAMNRLHVRRITAYLFVGLLLWVCIHASGVHATVAGVLLGLLMPAKRDGAPSQRLEHALHAWVAFAIMPVFAFANAGVPLEGIRAADLLQPLPLGIAVGLFMGKQLGIFVFSQLLVGLKLAKKPQDVGWAPFYGVCLLAGIGFTMSLFIGTLAFSEPSITISLRLGVITGSLCSAVAGYIVLAATLPKSDIRSMQSHDRAIRQENRDL